MEKGLIHVYCGDGKGKTTAACGLAVRAAGQKLRVVVVQFLKGSPSGEVEEMRKLGITVLRNSRDYGFLNQMSDAQRLAITEEHNRNLAKALRLVEEGACDLLVLDEAAAAYQYHVLDEKKLETLIREKPDGLELVLTGRNPDALFLEYADYITQMTERRHPMERGICARKGIEY